MEQYDVIVVGLSWAGMSTVYYCAKKGLRVLGIEQYSCPGSIGASSFGETRQWSAIYSSDLQNNMMWEAVKLWKQIEEESSEKLIYSLPFLWIGTDKNKYFKDMLDFFPKIKLLNADEICEKYPALKNIPADYKGILTTDGGIVQAKTALRVCRELAEIKYGAKLLFNTKVAKFGKNQVETADGTIYTAKHVVMACGVNWIDYTTSEDKHFKLDIGYAVMSDGSGLPGGFLEYDHNNQEYYGMVDGDKLEGYKMGISRNGKVDRILEYYLKRIPDKVKFVKYLQLSKECYTESHTFQYKTDENGVHFVYGFGGEGFMYFPMHGKVVYDGLINKTDQTYIPPRYKAKI